MVRGNYTGLVTKERLKADKGGRKMKTISIINLKGGVAKTISATNMAHILATVHNKKVLLVDNDKQGNASKMFGVHSYNTSSIADIMTVRRPDMRRIIAKTKYENLDLIPANMKLLKANLEVMLDNTRPQQTRLQVALESVADQTNSEIGRSGGMEDGYIHQQFRYAENIINSCRQ